MKAYYLVISVILHVTARLPLDENSSNLVLLLLLLLLFISHQIVGLDNL